MIADQLKKAVLQSAIQGKLTEQLSEDGNAWDLLAEICAEKSRLIKTGEIKKEKHMAQFNEDDMPFEIPHNWCWCFLQDIAIKIHYGFTASAQPSGRVKMLRITDIQENSVNWEKVPYCEITENKLPSYILRNRDIVIARTGGTVGKTYIINDINHDSVFASYLIRVILFDDVYEHYVKFFMESELYWQQLKDKSQGTGQPNVNGTALKGLLLPLPPLNEQYRIVEKLEKILPVIEILSVDETKLDDLQQYFPGQMKSSILQAAIQGKLTEQLPEDGDANDLLEEIKAEKERLIKEGKIKKEKPLPEITEDEIPFDIPDNWCWVRFGNIVEFHLGKTPPRGELKYWGSKYPWVSIADINDGGVISETKEMVTQIAFKDILHGKISPKGSLIMSFKLSIGKTSILGFDAFHNEAIITIKPLVGNQIIKEYFLKTLKLLSNNADTRGTIKGNTLNSTSIKNMLIPLPPLAEQKRIVQRLEKLLPLCDALE